MPPHLVQAVADLIANDGGASPPSKPAVGSLIHGWTEDDLRKHYANSSENMKAFMVFLAQNADTEVTSIEAANSIGVEDWNSVAGMLGAAGRRAKNHYGQEEGPWNRRWDGENRGHFKMPADVAAIILDAAQA